MTLEQQTSLQRELETAIDTGDLKLVNRAQSNILLALMDCQRKTSDRVKRIQFAVYTLLTGGGACAAIEAKWGVFTWLFH